MKLNFDLERSRKFVPPKVSLPAKYFTNKGVQLPPSYVGHNQKLTQGRVKAVDAVSVNRNEERTNLVPWQVRCFFQESST